MQSLHVSFCLFPFRRGQKSKQANERRERKKISSKLWYPLYLRQKLESFFSPTFSHQIWIMTWKYETCVNEWKCNSNISNNVNSFQCIPNRKLYLFGLDFVFVVCMRVSKCAHTHNFVSFEQWQFRKFCHFNKVTHCVCFSFVVFNFCLANNNVMMKLIDAIWNINRRFCT